LDSRPALDHPIRQTRSCSERHEGRKGIAAHYVLIYLLLIDKVTEAYDDDDGTKTGVVLGGTPVSFKDIATALGCCYSTAQRATAHLVRVGLIRRQWVSMTDGYRWEVLNCRKALCGKQRDETIRMEDKTYSRKPMEGSKISEEEIEFLGDTTATTTFNIEDEDEDDDLA
jgi:hypothetical protein